MPERRAICAGDLLIWVFPNAGNPQKVQRYPHEWALALRTMAALRPELVLPAHGEPTDRSAIVVEDIIRRETERWLVRAPSADAESEDIDDEPTAEG